MTLFEGCVPAGWLSEADLYSIRSSKIIQYALITANLCFIMLNKTNIYTHDVRSLFSLYITAKANRHTQDALSQSLWPYLL